jgi:hypothetical protein
MGSKAELRKKFNLWLGYEFDNKNKRSKGETHRWLFCEDEIYEKDKISSDCACCMDDVERKDCGCHCHDRIGEIVDFFWKELGGK